MEILQETSSITKKILYFTRVPVRCQKKAMQKY